jgi:hypothetical protein
VATIDTLKEPRRIHMTQRDVAKQKPIGYWLKYADEVITEHVDRVLSDNGFTRFCWQVLNIIYQAGAITESGVFDTMQTFIDRQQLGEILDRFVEQGWLVSAARAMGRNLRSRVRVRPNAKPSSSCRARCEDERCKASQNKNTRRSSTC